MASWRLTWRDRTLLFLALIAGFCGVAALAAAFVVVAGHIGSHHLGNSRLTAAALLALYPLTFLVVFAHVAMAAAAGAKLEGGHISVGEAFSTAHRRTARIALWALVASGFGLLLRLAGTQLSDGVGAATWPLDLLWVLATIFVVPLLALEDASLREAFHGSRSLLQRGWGEGLVGIVLIGVFGVLLVLPGFFLLAVGVAMAVLASGGGLILIAVGLIGIAVAKSLSGALQQVFAVELYRYAARPSATN